MAATPIYRCETITTNGMNITVTFSPAPQANPDFIEMSGNLLLSSRDPQFGQRFEKGKNYGLRFDEWPTAAEKPTPAAPKSESVSQETKPKK